MLGLIWNASHGKAVTFMSEYSWVEGYWSSAVWETADECVGMADTLSPYLASAQILMEGSVCVFNVRKLPSPPAARLRLAS